MDQKIWFSGKLTDWYKGNKRELPWRDTKNPYFIWLSEIILQQTRVNQGLPYYFNFISQYKTIADLANAPEMEVLRLWQGLGYYSRARNMLNTAKVIVNEGDGKFPDSYQKLIKLKGIGDYTASAISSFAFEEKVAVLDGNVFRVLSRIFNVKEDISSSSGKKYFKQLANSLLPSGRVSEYNQAIMEFGALACTPKNPDCPNCIFLNKCEAFALGTVAELPVKKQKAKVVKRYFSYFVITYNGKILMKERKKSDIWKGLFDFYLIENNEHYAQEFSDDEFLQNIFFNFKDVKISESIEYKHILTHRIILAKFLKIEVFDKEIANMDYSARELNFYDLKEIKRIPKSVLIDKYLTDNFF